MRVLQIWIPAMPLALFAHLENDAIKSQLSGY